jgi:site-specific DNA-methyltransferase (adenine-specific)
MQQALLTSKSNEWETPQELFDSLNEKYSFTLDPCSTHENAKCKQHYTIEEDGLSKDWTDERVFCNPPYGREISKWVKKCSEEKALCVMLIPARTDTRYFHDYIYNKPDVDLTFLKGRLKFCVGGQNKTLLHSQV